MATAPEPTYDPDERAELGRRIAIKIADPETARWAAATRAAIADGSIRNTP